ncbi:hypothetical protein L218DRAFT_1001141 [Marasmius fiardii PR-910]|nr:hypothetical protein L218DRAFT_1001141 [Marasmius fiardii PR-910]
MVIILSRKKTGFNTATDDAITRIIRLTVETGSLTAVLAVITVALFFGLPARAYWNVPIDVLGKLYSNNLMVILNRRIKISDGRSSNAPQTTSARSLEFNSRPNRNIGNVSVGADMPIKIQREVWSQSDNIKMDDIGNPSSVGTSKPNDSWERTDSPFQMVITPARGPSHPYSPSNDHGV